MKTSFILAIAAITLSSCSSGYGEKEIKRFSYDPRVDLCFAWSSNGYGDVATNVPCNDLVLYQAGVQRLPAASEPRADGLRP